MPNDLRLQRTCSHEIFDEQVTIAGSSPSFFSTLNYTTDGSTKFMSVREFSETEGLSNYNFERDGFSNWELATDNVTVNWNALTTSNFGSSLGGVGTGIASFLDAATNIIPQQTMLVSYRCKPDTCPLCIDLGNDRDLLTQDTEITVRGQLAEVSGITKIKQLVFKALLTELGVNEILPTYGSTISASIGEKFTILTEFKLHNSVEQAVRFLINEQQNQPNLPLNETILNVSRISLAQDAVDPRIVRVQLDILVASFEKVPVTFQIVNQ